MKRIQTFLFIALVSIQFVGAKNIYVAPNGNDHAAGIAEAPLASLQMAIRQAREYRRLNGPDIKEDIQIIMQGGTYAMVDPVICRPEDSGNKKSRTIIQAAEGAEVSISGGVEVLNWQKVTSEIAGLPKKAQGKVWEADVPRVGGNRLLFRQMWVDGEKAIRANTINDGKLPRILSVDNENELLWIPNSDMDLTKAQNLELVIHQWWAIANLRVKEMKTQGDSTSVAFYQPESKIEFEHPWPAPFIDAGDTLNGNSAFYFTNAIELLNGEGEWFEDFDNGKIYYWPRKGEDMAKAKVVVPYLENLLSIEGNLDNPVSYIEFKNIKFEHTSWLRPSFKGSVPLQAGIYLTEAYKLKEPGTPAKAELENQAWLGRPSAGISVRYGNHLSFQYCEMQHMAATGIDFVEGTHHNLVEGCIVSDIGGTGIQVGYFGDDSYEAHLAFDPSEDRVLCHHEMIRNNVVTDVTNEDWGCVGIGIGFAHDISIEHNEVSHVNYSAISVGWGWSKDISCMQNNVVFANHIHHFARMMYDVAGVYTLGAQPNTRIEENSIHTLLKAPYAHIPNHHQYLYTDEGSSFMQIKNNWTEKDKFFANCNGPGNVWENNGPQVSDEIKNKAGLTEEFKYLLDKVQK